MVHGRNRIPYRIDRRLSGLAGPDYDATISFGLPIEPEGSQYGESRLHKHLWKLPIPEFDSHEPMHVAISGAGQAAAKGAAEELAKLHRQRDRVTVTIARRELRKWLADSQEGRAVETLVGELLSQ